MVRGVQDISIPANNNLRVISPVFYFAYDGNNVPTYLTFSFKVFDPTSSASTPIFTTTSKTVKAPAMPCVNPQGWNFGMNPNFFGRWGGKREFAAIDLSISCNETSDGSYHQADVTFVYAANVQNGVSAWSQSYPNPLIAFNGLDIVNNTTGVLETGAAGIQDGQDDTVMLVMQSGSQIRTVLLNKDTGTPFSNPSWKLPSDRLSNIGNPPQ